MKTLDVVFTVMELLLQSFISHSLLLPTKLRFDNTAFFNSFYFKKTERTSTGQSRDHAILRSRLVILSGEKARDKIFAETFVHDNTFLQFSRVFCPSLLFFTPVAN